MRYIGLERCQPITKSIKDSICTFHFIIFTSQVAKSVLTLIHY